MTPMPSRRFTLLALLLAAATTAFAAAPNDTSRDASKDDARPVVPARTTP